jgi:hypothetical protein
MLNHNGSVADNNNKGNSIDGDGLLAYMAGRFIIWRHLLSDGNEDQDT